jgi:hypothetical protein
MLTDAYLGIEIRRIWELLHHHVAEMMKQRVLVNRILHFRYLDEIFQLKALHLKKDKVLDKMHRMAKSRVPRS